MLTYLIHPRPLDGTFYNAHFRGVRGSKRLNNTPKATTDVAELGLGPTTIQPQHLNSQSQSQINLTGGSHSSPNLKIVIAMYSTKLVLRVGKRPL